VIRRLLLLVAVLLVTGTAAWADTVKSKVAPADEYFGRLKMSVLGIANTIKDMRLRVVADADKTPSIFGSLAMVEDAIRDWERKYPRDSWVAKDLYALEVTYLTAPGERAHAMAIRTEAWLHRDYPKTAYARQAQAALNKPMVTARTASEPVVQPAIITVPVVPQAPAEGAGIRP